MLPILLREVIRLQNLYSFKKNLSIEFIGVILVGKTLQVSSVQLSKSSASFMVCLLPKVKPLSTYILVLPLESFALCEALSEFKLTAWNNNELLFIPSLINNCFFLVSHPLPGNRDVLQDKQWS